MYSHERTYINKYVDVYLCIRNVTKQEGARSHTFEAAFLLCLFSLVCAMGFCTTRSFWDALLEWMINHKRTVQPVGVQKAHLFLLLLLCFSLESHSLPLLLSSRDVIFFSVLTLFLLTIFKATRLFALCQELL